MNNANADIYEDARLYDALSGQHFGGEDFAYWQAQCRVADGPVLELGCGTGRLTIPLAEGGADIEGLDLSAPMLALAREKSDAQGQAIFWHQGNMVDFTLNRQFALIFLPNNSVAHLLTWQDLAACLRCVRRHLAPGGRFALDYFNPSLALLTRDPNARFPAGSLEAPGGTGRVTLTEQVSYASDTQTSYARWVWTFADGREKVSDLTMRVYFPQELDALLACAGFVIDAKYGDYDLSAFGPASQKQLIAAHPA